MKKHPSKIAKNPINRCNNRGILVVHLIKLLNFSLPITLRINAAKIVNQPKICIINGYLVPEAPVTKATPRIILTKTAKR
jgi:hypothetical protein